MINFKQFLEGYLELATPDARTMQKMTDTGKFLSGTCYTSARQFAHKIDAQYVEGVIIGGYPPHKILHAWTEKDGNVYDPTLPAAYSIPDYYKIFKAKPHLKMDALEAVIKSAKYNTGGPIEVPEGWVFKKDRYIPK